MSPRDTEPESCGSGAAAPQSVALHKEASLHVVVCLES